MSRGPKTARLISLAQTLNGEGRHGDALAIVEYLLTVSPGDAELRLEEARALGGQGDILAALERLRGLRDIGGEALLAEIRVQSLAAIERFNAHLEVGEVEAAETYASALAALMPQNPAMVAAAFSCNQALERPEIAAAYAHALLALVPDHPQALAYLGLEATPAEPDLDQLVAAALASDQNPLLKLRDLHDAASRILCRPLADKGLDQLRLLLAAARDLEVPVDPGSEWEGWERHYRLLMSAVDLDMVLGPTPQPGPEADLECRSAKGEVLDWAGLRAHADRLGARCVFFAAADEAYVDLYARWYALSVLKYGDVPALIVVHVIGGMGKLAEIAARVGIDDDRLVFAADTFDATKALATGCFDAPPKGRAEKPIAHYQCVRFIRLGALLAHLERPVFVSDIDLILQRGVADLLDRTAGADVVFNENTENWNAGSRLTANLLQVNPTPGARTLLAFLRVYLERALSGPAVTRWIDQVALILARHHLLTRLEAPAIDYFDTSSDINNVMYPSYQAHPFRFLSLFHGFDTSSLEGDPRVLGAET